MGIKTGISWTDATWNPAVGCSKVDSDCLNCYMYRESLNNTRYNPMKVRRTTTVFKMPLKLKVPSKIFTASLTDIFHEDIDSYRNEIWDIIRKCPQHTFQILTKRPERIKDCLPDDWGNGWDNVWLGTSIGSQKAIQRYYDLINIPAKIRFLSIEPLHGEVDLSGLLSTNIGTYCNDCGDPHLMACDNDDCIHKPINWIIVGGESGNNIGKYKFRPCKIDWIENIIVHCKVAKVPVFVKQLGTHLAKELKLDDRHGGIIEEFPAHLRIREFPVYKK